MWRPDKKRLVKVRLQDSGGHVETPWAEDLGPAPGVPGGRTVRLGNVPFLHAKPTYGDVMLVTPDPVDGVLSWDLGDLEYEQIQERLVEDGGRWTMILDYQLRDATEDAQEAFSALDRAGERADIAVAGCYGPKPGRAGRAYLAVPGSLTVESVLALLDRAQLPVSLTLVHPRD